MKPDDAIGTPLNTGDLVMIQHGETQLLAYVREIKEPTVISNPNPTQRQQPGIIVLDIMPESIPFNPLVPSRIQSVTRVVEPPQFKTKPA